MNEAAVYTRGDFRHTGNQALYQKYTAQSQCRQTHIRSYLGYLLVFEVIPEMGISVEGKTGVETDLRMLICENWAAFYRIETDSGIVSVARIIDVRQDYMHILFGEKSPASDG